MTANNMILSVIFVTTEGEVLVVDRDESRPFRLKENVAVLTDLKIKSSSSGRQRQNILTFSSNQQWLLKYLLLNGVDKKYWMPRDNRNFAVSTELSSAAGISQSHCYESIKALENMGFMVPDSRSYRFRNLNNLIELWRSELFKSSKTDIYVEPKDFKINPEILWKHLQLNYQDVSKQLSFKIAFSGTPALSEYDLRLVPDFFMIIHSGSTQATSLEKLLDIINLVKSEEKTSIKIVLHKSSKPVSEIAETRPGGIPPIVDILQLYFDNIFFGVRGQEQSEKIFQKVLSPFWQAKGWSL